MLRSLVGSEMCIRDSMKGVWFALGLTLFAGMATGIGSIVAFTARRTDYRLSLIHI